MSNKNVLHRNKLVKFSEWLLANDIDPRDPKGDFEVLRFKPDQGGAMPIIFNGSSHEHLSCNNAAMPYVLAFIKEHKKKSVIPSDKGKNFKCTRQTMPDLDVWHINGLMCIAHHEDPIYITKEQAMKFFDLK